MKRTGAPAPRSGDRALHDRMTWQLIDRNGRIARRGVEDRIEWYTENGTITRRIGVDEVIDARCPR